ncbi:hypothetical protein OUY22_32855 [Nonomuraea sp. MCN248]|uniref:Uncharacterized protein n=1 Tax=Nonomuraea corallina TaxID=2989783 RepID=A0ABT4SLW1_9ACTN|nr:hypothetical protein [Nonomuraea corallina]MDA0638222.1 hypothetical protein [Nonomuraea corallina]
MGNNSPDLRFGIKVAGLRSRTWRVRSGASKPELFLEREGLEKAAHISLHESGSWHYKTNKRESVRWTRPAEIAAGFTRAVLIVQPVAVAMISLADPDGAHLIEVDVDSDAMNFDVFIERPGTDLSSWPGRTAMGTVLVGRIPLANNAGWCSVVARQAPLTLDPIELPRPDEDTIQKMREAAEQDGLYMTSVHDVSDGTKAFVDGRLILNAHS